MKLLTVNFSTFLKAVGPNSVLLFVPMRYKKKSVILLGTSKSIDVSPES